MMDDWWMNWWMIDCGWLMVMMIDGDDSWWLMVIIIDSDDSWWLFYGDAQWLLMVMILMSDVLMMID